MALDRQSIEKTDFPVGRRGYDPDAVDAHLTALADEIADFKRSARRRSDTLASSASDQVRAIVEAAETSASDIQREAETEAREIREEATAEAKATRDQATEQARDYISSVSESAAAMMQRIDAMESELSALIDSLRTGGNRLESDLRLLESNLSEVGDAVTPRHRFEPEEDSAPAPAPPAADFSTESDEDETVTAEPVEGYDGADHTDPESHFSVAEPDDAEVVGEAGAASQAEEQDDAEGARLIALNMALNGTPRDETAKYLSENFSLSDSDGLLDEVYASVEG